MTGDIISYGLLASIFVVNGLRMWMEKPNGTSDQSITWLDRFKRRAIQRSKSIDS
jgi:hypothetical protein